MPTWIQTSLDVVQLAVNVGALVGGAFIWKLYVDNLKAALTAKDAEVSSVEKSRDYWKEQAQELEKRSPEFMEGILSERIQTREKEIARLMDDKDKNSEFLKGLLREKAGLESDLSRTRGFRLMLALEESDQENVSESTDLASLTPLTAQIDEIRVVLLGEVAVDSGQLMVTDPCYIDQEWQHPSLKPGQRSARGVHSLPEYSYQGAMTATLSGEGFGELAFGLGHSGAGVVFGTAWGDGMYPIYGELHDGRIIWAYINLG